MNASRRWELLNLVLERRAVPGGSLVPDRSGTDEQMGEDFVDIEQLQTKVADAHSALEAAQEAAEASPAATAALAWSISYCKLAQFGLGQIDAFPERSSSARSE